MADGSRTRAATQRPQSIDELAAMPDVAATEEMPKDVANALATQRLFIHSTKEVSSVKFVKEPSSPHKEYTLELPPGALMGRPGLSGERLERSAHKLPNATHTEGMRPAWAPLALQARNAAADRRVYYPNAYPWRCVGRISSGGESITGTPFGWWNEDNNIEAGGRSLVDLVLWAQANWP